MTDFGATQASFHLPDGLTAIRWGRFPGRPWRVPARIGAVVGTVATGDTLSMGDTLSIKVYQARATALEMRPDRRVRSMRWRRSWPTGPGTGRNSAGGRP